MNSFGRIFRINIFGESHGKAVGINIDGCPAGIPLCEDDFIADIARRKAGAKGTTPRIESDLPNIISGVFNGYTTGAPIVVLFENSNTKSKDYSNLLTTPRPGHADFVAQQKYHGFNDHTGGGHFSGRLTLALVVAGVVAKKIIPDIEIRSELIEVGGKRSNYADVIDEAIARCDSVGGIIECRANAIPVGLGEPFFDAVESVIAHLAFSIPAIKGIEFGAGFQAAKLFGSEHNDTISQQSGKTSTNNAGGINGGITNGNELIFRVAVKPTSSIGVQQNTFNFKSGKIEQLQIKGRHDACIALRVPVIVEAITAIALADFSLIRKSQL